MPENVTPERTELLRMYGAEIVYSEGSKGSNGAVEKALDMAENDASYYMPYQYGNRANPDAHYNGTALEILEELDEVAAFVAGLGTGGTLMGNGRRLKEELGDEVKIVAAEPMQGEPVQGLRSLEDGFIPPIIDLSLLDRKIFVTNHDAIVFTRKLLDEERVFAGVSSGAIARVAVRIAGELDEGNVVFIVCDDGWKYLSSGIYTRPRRGDREPGLHRLVVSDDEGCARRALLTRRRCGAHRRRDAAGSPACGSTPDDRRHKAVKKVSQPVQRRGPRDPRRRCSISSVARSPPTRPGCRCCAGPRPRWPSSSCTRSSSTPASCWR